MFLRIASLLSVVTFIQVLLVSVKISNVVKYYADYISTNIEETFHPITHQEYDFIIVGSGSAGSVLANRLSKYNKVLLIEAGGTPFYANHVPMMAGQLLHTKEVDYMYKTVPQEHGCHGQPEKMSHWPRGKLLGGSSNLNYMMYIRAHPLDYDNWANQTSDESWSYKNLLKYFKRSIDYNGNYPNDYHHGYLYGSQSVEASHGSFLTNKIWMDAGKELGFKSNIDINAEQRTGFGRVDANSRNGKRESGYTAFIEPILQRKNLVITKYSQAFKIKFDKENRAIGVWYEQFGQRKYAKARKEVVISAGSVDSPKLLMLSGIGPDKHLKEIGIKPRVNLPVGQNLKDHVITFLMPFTVNTSITFCAERDLGIYDMIEYYTKGTGVFSLPLGAYSHAYFTTEFTKKQNLEAGKSNLKDWTDIQMLILNAGPNSEIAADFSKFMKVRKEILEQLYRESVLANRDGFIITLTLGRPKSVGEILLKSKDHNEDPVIDPMYLSHPDDLPRLVQAIKFAFKVVEETKAFQAINATYPNAPIYDCRMYKFKSDKYWECYLKHISLTMYHPIGTCKMGSGANDKSAVVDSKLRVLHTKGLRVADASIMPDLINGNTNAPTVMIGEKAADMIREHWANQYLVCSKLETIFRKKFSHLQMCFYSRLS